MDYYCSFLIESALKRHKFKIHLKICNVRSKKKCSREKCKMEIPLASVAFAKCRLHYVQRCLFIISSVYDTRVDSDNYFYAIILTLLFK